MSHKVKLLYFTRKFKFVGLGTFSIWTEYKHSHSLGMAVMIIETR